MENKKIDYSAQGKRNRAAGQRFEAKVREGLEKMDWVVSKWMNVVDQDKNGNIGGIIPAKRKYNPFNKAMVIGTGFPDFVAFKKTKDNYEIIGVEVKTNGYLDKVEKGMCVWLLQNNIFSKILIAKKKKINERKFEVEYVDFEEKYGKKQNS